MSELGETIAEVIEEAGESRLGTIVALLVALAATFVALAGVKDRNLTLGMTRAQTKAVDAWNQYQAKSMKQNLAEATLDEMLAMQEVSGGAAAAAQLAKRIETYHGQVARYEREKEEIKAQAEGYEHRVRGAQCAARSVRPRGGGHFRGDRPAGRDGADAQALAARGGRRLPRSRRVVRGGGIPELEYSRRGAGFLAGVVPMSLLHSPEADSPR